MSALAAEELARESEVVDPQSSQVKRLGFLLTSSLKGRLIAVAAVWVALGIALAGVALSEILKNNLTEQFYGDLADDLKELDGLISKSGLEPTVIGKLRDVRYDEPRSGYYWEIQKAGKIVTRSPSLAGPKFEVPQTFQPRGVVHTHLVEGPTGDVIVAELIHEIGRGVEPLRVIVGADRRHLDELILKKFDTTLVWSLGTLAICLFCAATILILYTFVPMARLRRALAEVRIGRSTTLSGRYPSEIQPLVDDLNSMLEATRKHVQRARVQAGNLAHGLRTSLAILTDEAERLARSGKPEAAKVILGQCRRMQCQVDYQLARARAAGKMTTPGTSCNPHAIIGEIATALSRMHTARDIALRNCVDQSLMVACDVQDFHEIMANLIDNAFKFSHRSIVVSSGDSLLTGFVEIAIDDDGPGLPEKARSVVFDVGARWDTQVSGSGLGLAIVRELVDAYDGKIVLSDSLRGGLRVGVSLRAVTLDGPC